MAKDKPTVGQVASFVMPDVTYRSSSDVAEVAERVIKRFPEKFGHLLNARIATLLRDSKRSEDAFSVDGSGGSFIRTDRERAIFPEADLGLWFRRKWWDGMTIAQREAWVFHQLSHLAPRPSGGGIVRIGHDVEAFADEPVHFGAWEEQLSLFEQNLDQYTPGAAIVRARRPEDRPQAPVN